MLPNKGILLNGVLIPKIRNYPLVFCSLSNLDFLQSHISYFDNNIVLPLLFFQTLGFTFSVVFSYFKQNDSNET